MTQHPALLPHRLAARLVGALILGVALAGCTALPQIPPLAQNTANPPQLVPLEGLLAGIAAPRATADSSNALAARAMRLQTRALLMRGPVLSPETRSRLAAAIARGDA